MHPQHALLKQSFGKDFLWGVAISAAQNEGAWNIDGRGASIWDQFAKRQGKIKGNGKPSVASDFYYRYKDDLMLVKAMGFNCFRFSISWSRILPEGIGKINKEGIAYYDRVIDECLQLGLVPFVTLYHWDLPAALQKDGGWASHQMLKWFTRFVQVCTDAFGDRVKNWIVLNEPMGFTSLGYMLGKHAPGKTGLSYFLPAVHNAVLCQAEGGRIIRANISRANIGTSFSCSEVMPFTQKEEDIKAARRADILLNRLFIEPLLGRGYPQEPGFTLLDKLHLHNKAWKYTERMQFNFDFIGISEVKAVTRKVPHTAMGWEINPDSFYRMIKRFWLYGGVKQIIISESGAAFKDHISQGVINDADRVQYFQQYLNAALRAKKEGINIGGYFAWTLTDNFEWAEGYQARFGLVHVDFETQLRTIKQSGYWFRDFLHNKI